jgi:hypothetical protein
MLSVIAAAWFMCVFASGWPAWPEGLRAPPLGIVDDPGPVGAGMDVGGDEAGQAMHDLLRGRDEKLD